MNLQENGVNTPYTPYLEPEDVEWVLKNPFPFLKAYRERTGDIEGVPKHIVDLLVERLTMSGDPGDIDRHIERLASIQKRRFYRNLTWFAGRPGRINKNDW